MTLSLEQIKANRKLWVEALRGGKYKQTMGKLKARNGAMCCLGVLSDIAGCEWRWTGRAYSADLELDFAPDKAMDFVGLRTPDGSAFGSRVILSQENDAGASFLKIADIIESEPEGLFIESVQP